MNVRGNGFGGLANIAQVRFVVLIERRRDADNQGIHILGMGIFVRGPKALGASGGNLGWRDAIDIRPAIIQGLYLFRVDIEPSDGKAGFIEEQGQRQPDITKANDSDFCGMRLNASEQRLERLRTGSSCWRHKQFCCIGADLGNVAHEIDRCMTLSLLPEPTWLLPLALLSALITHLTGLFRLFFRSKPNTLGGAKGAHLTAASVVLICSHR